MFRILVVEDNEELNRTICSYLNKNDFEAIPCLNASQALEKLYVGNCDLIISDIMMPGMDGFELAKKIRVHNENLPILFLTAKDDFASKQRGYVIGIDDYMTKPFNFEELILRIGALLRRAKIAQSNSITIGSITLNRDEHIAYINGEEITLTVREFDILFKLLSYPKKTFTRTQLINEFWNESYTANPRVVDVYITKLREKLSECRDFEIVTVHGLGYKAVLANEK